MTDGRGAGRLGAALCLLLLSAGPVAAAPKAPPK